MTQDTPDKVRVLIVDDDPTYRLILTKTFERIPGVHIVGTAATLAIARAKLERDAIDLVSLDVVLREESGLDLLPWLREHRPNVITALVTAGTTREARRAVDALLLGASALVLKPSMTDPPDSLLRSLSEVVRGIERKPAKGTSLAPSPSAARGIGREPREVIAIGASTGGPPVVSQFLQSLPPEFTTPMLLTQHMPAVHVPFFAELLARESGRNVKVMANGDVVRPGFVYVAGDGKHMRLGRSEGRLVLSHDDGPEEHNCKPAVDPMFRSVAEVSGAASVGVVMTGMGTDGALGASALRQKGAPVVVQDRETSVVWGMPGATAAAGAACAIVPARKLADVVASWTAVATAFDTRGR